MKIHKVLGIMSGTSLDGLDMACCHFWQEAGQWEYKIQAATTIPYENSLQLRLRDAVLLNPEDLLMLHNEYGTYIGHEAKSFIEKEKLKVDFIASHGHTVHHRPDLGFTLQIGSGQHLANKSGLSVVCDFRSKDVSLGGQGAPLVPIGDQAFFKNYTFCLNLGGISNISLDIDGQRIAFDIGVANMLLNYVSEKVDMPFDKGGDLARTGKLNNKFLEDLDSLDYYDLPFPKSTGFEWFKDDIIPIIEESRKPIQDLLHTAVHHICKQIARQLKPLVNSKHSTLLVTGGGAYNNFLIEVLKQNVSPQIEVVIPSDDLVSFKEALIFAFMGLLRMEGQINVLSSVTGASKDSSSGVIYHHS